MDKRAQLEQASGHGENLEQIEQRFRRWRESRRRGERIPAALWAAGVGMAKEHGVERIAHALRVDEARLRKRLEHAGGVGRQSPTQFVELFAAPAFAAAGMRECIVEMQNARGAKMRVELSGDGLAGLAGLCSAFWGAP